MRKSKFRETQIVSILKDAEAGAKCAFATASARSLTKSATASAGDGRETSGSWRTRLRGGVSRGDSAEAGQCELLVDVRWLAIYLDEHEKPWLLVHDDRPSLPIGLRQVFCQQRIIGRKFAFEVPAVDKDDRDGLLLEPQTCGHGSRLTDRRQGGVSSSHACRGHRVSRQPTHLPRRWTDPCCRARDGGPRPPHPRRVFMQQRPAAIASEGNHTVTSPRRTRA